MAPMNVNHPTLEYLRCLQPFNRVVINSAIRDMCTQDEWDTIQWRYEARVNETIDYAVGYNQNKSEGLLDRERIRTRTEISMFAEFALAFIIDGLEGIEKWMENDDFSFDVPTSVGHNIEVKCSNFWPTMHTAGSAPFGMASDGVCLYSGLVGNADIYLFFKYEQAIETWHPNYFFSKRALRQYPTSVAVVKPEGGAYVNRGNRQLNYFYKWCTK